MEITTNTNYYDPAEGDIEVVERKGYGHPDTLADGLANYLSLSYSKYCLSKFGCILHHNFDKLYIGGGMFVSDFGSTKMIKPIKVVINGRVSNEFGGKNINVEKIQKDAVKKYLKMILPNIDVDKHLKIHANSTQNTPNLSHPFWYKPRDTNDLPELKKLTANDTSVAISHSPRTKTEEIAVELEGYFWDISSKNYLRARYSDFGQDIKVMVKRVNHNYEVIMCIPIISTKIKNLDDYYKKIKDIENQLNKYVKQFINSKDIITVNVNPSVGTLPRIYILGIGSCVEGGEEGVVGRGNDNHGVISVFRPHTVEAPFGKNPKYHTGRVMSFFTKKISDTLYKLFAAKSTVIAMTRNQHSLVPPSDLIVSTDKELKKEDISKVVNDVFNETDYVKEILKENII